MSAAARPMPDPEAPPLEWALWHAVELGWPVFPAHGIVKKDGELFCTCGKRADDTESNGGMKHSPGKHPATANGFKDATVDADQIRAWWKENPSYNPASAHPSVADLDRPRASSGDDGIATWEKLAKQNKLPGYLPRAKSGNGGQVYFAPGSTSGNRAPGISMRGVGNYVVLPGGRHYSGVRYVYTHPPLVGRALPAEPEWLAAGEKNATRRVKRQLKAGKRIPVNDRHDAIKYFLIETVNQFQRIGLERLVYTGLGFVHANCESPEERYDHVEPLAEWVLEHFSDGLETDVIDVPEWDGKLAALLDDICKLIQRYFVIGKAETRFLALWVAHTYVFEAIDVTPYGEIHSPTRRCGKSNLLKLMSMLARNPEYQTNPSDASLFRILDEYPKNQAPSLFIDEMDQILKTAKDRPDLIAMLNAGYEEGATIPRVEGQYPNLAVRRFPVFAPKMFASIGELRSETIRDRSVPIALTRKGKDKKVSRFRRRSVRDACKPHKARLFSWAEAGAADELRKVLDAEPGLPDELDDRAQDFWEALLGIADLAGGKWPTEARAASLELCAGRDAADDSLAMDLLRRCHTAFHPPTAYEPLDALFTADLIASVCTEIDSPWRDWWWDVAKIIHKGSAGRNLSQRLRAFGIHSDPQPLRIGDEKKRGYRREAFEASWSQYGIVASRDIEPVDETAPLQPLGLASPSSNGKTDLAGLCLICEERPVVAGALRCEECQSGG
jgi:hypothetical protein